MNSFRLRRQFPHHYLASFHVFSAREMLISKQLLVNLNNLSPELFEKEVQRWKARYPRIEPELRPVSPALATKECEASFYPIWSNIACTILVTSCECKRSASTLRCLNNYMKASMGKSRLSRLALLHIHSQTTVNLDLPWSGSRYLYAATSQENTTGKPSVTVPLQYCSVIIEKKNKETS